MTNFGEGEEGGDDRGQKTQDGSGHAVFLALAREHSFLAQRMSV